MTVVIVGVLSFVLGWTACVILSIGSRSNDAMNEMRAEEHQKMVDWINERDPIILKRYQVFKELGEK